MKKQLIYIVCLAIAITACEVNPPYTTKGTTFSFQVDNQLGTQATITATPEDDRGYYYFGVIEAERYRQAQSDEQLMTLITDSLKRTYNAWLEYQKIIAELQGVEPSPYATDFCSFTLIYGEHRKSFYMLSPETDYYAFAFSVNPENNMPIGTLSKQLFTTSALDTTVSPMVIDFRLEMKPGEIGLHTLLSLRPSINSQATSEPYLWSIVSADELKTTYNDNPTDYADAYIQQLQTHGIVEYMLEYDISSYEIFLEDNTEYILLASPYRATYHKSLSTLHFTAKSDTIIEYTRDK